MPDEFIPYLIYEFLPIFFVYDISFDEFIPHKLIPVFDELNPKVSDNKFNPKLNLRVYSNNPR
jgi:hypothetical protein